MVRGAFERTRLVDYGVVNNLRLLSSALLKTVRKKGALGLDLVLEFFRGLIILAGARWKTGS
jgi:hypothetical protein